MLTLLSSQPGSAFALCDASEQGVAIVGYIVSRISPRLQLRAFEPVSRSSLAALVGPR